MREREDDGERRGDRAGGERERHEHGEREAEHGEEHRERDRQRDRLAAQQVVREHGLEVVLDRGLAGHVRARLARERAPHRRRVALRVLEVERRVDLAVEEAAVGAQLRRVRAGHELRGGVEAPLRCGEVGAVRAEDDGEDAVGPLAEVVLEDLARRVGLRAGTVKVFERCFGSAIAARTPTTSTASQTSRIGARKRRTARVQRSGTA